MTSMISSWARSLGLAVLLGAPAAEAAPRSLSQEQAVDVALERHPALEAATRAIEVAEARESQTESAWLPRVKAEASYLLMGPVQSLTIDTGLTPPGSTAPIVISREMGSLHNAGFGASVAWRALDFGNRLVRTEAAAALVRAEQAQGEQQRAEIAYAVRAAYLAARFFQEMEATTGRSLEVAKQTERNATLQRSAGLGSDLEVARAKMRAAELDAQHTRAGQERARAEATLRLLLGLGPDAPVALSDDLRRLGMAPLPPRGPSSDSPTQQRLGALAEAAELESERLFWEWWPTIDVVGSVKYQYPKNYFENDAWGGVYSAGAVWTWNVFDGDLVRRQRAEADARAAQLRAQARAADEDAERKLAEARAQQRTAEAAAASAQRTREAAQTYLRAAEASRAAGAGTDLEIDEARDSVDQAELGELKAYFEAALAHASLLLAQGKAKASEQVR